MISTGIVRSVDNLGRVVIPAEIRRTLGLDGPLEIFVDGEHVVLRKYAPGCVFCGQIGSTEVVKGKYVCKKCIKEIRGNV